MKRTNKLVAAAAVLTALTAVGTTVHAGTKITFGTSIYRNPAGDGYAEGAMGSARNSYAGSPEYVWCYTGVNFAGAPMGACAVYDANGQFAICNGTGYYQFLAMASAGPDSYIQFWWDTTGKCTYITVANASYNEPKLP